MLQGTGDTGQRAKQLRREMSPAEIALWFAPKDRPGDLKFRKQHPSGPFVADVHCHTARLAVEVDGEAHAFGDRPKRDELRDRWFAQRGLATLRVPARDVFSDADAVVRGIVDVAKQRVAKGQE